MTDTIFAEATAPGRAGVSVVRISGPLARSAVQALAGEVPPDRQAGLRRIRTEAGEVLDEALVLFFPAGHSFTGEDVAEIQLHGSRAVVAAVLVVLGGLDGLRMAQPGEFTRRAMEGGRLDLTQVEGLADLIEAETDLQRQQAMRVFRGGMSTLAQDWRVQLVRASALLAVTIDFADEDVPADVSAEVLDLVSAVRVGIEAELAASVFSERIRHGFEVAIVGPPNVGKSTLLNHLAGRDAAITSAVPGTTRDVLEVRMDLDGIPVTLLDTAGLRETADPVEAEGVARARKRAGEADLRVVLLAEGDDFDAEDIIVTPKSDLGVSGPGILISARSGAGIADLTDEIVSRLREKSAVSGSAIRQRHVAALKAAAAALETAGNHVEAGEFSELTAEEIRTATECLDLLIGRVGVEDILDIVFSGFCIGK